MHLRKPSRIVPPASHTPFQSRYWALNPSRGSGEALQILGEGCQLHIQLVIPIVQKMFYSQGLIQWQNLPCP